jgi:HK97 family phage major capsid protein
MPSSIRDRLQAVRDEIGETRDKRAAARQERDSAREAFASANHDGAVSEWPEFKAAQEAVRKCGEIDDKLADLKATEESILSIMGDDAPSNGGGSGRAGIGNVTPEQLAQLAQAAGWDGNRLLAGSEDQPSAYREAVERGLFTSQNKFGTVHLGQIASREDAVRFMSELPGATPGPVTSTTVALGIQPDRRGMFPPQLRRLTFLDLIPTGTTDSNSIEYVQVQAIPATSGPVAEGALKPEVGLALEDAAAPVRTIAGWIKVNRQAMDDMAGLATLINTLLPYDVRRKIEAQILAGDGTGQNLRGILNTTGLGAPPFVAGDNPADALLRAMTVVILSDADPNFAAVHPLLWQDIMLMRENGDRTGQYLAGGPFGITAPTVWGLALTTSTVIPQATPLVGDSMGATLLFREGVNVKTSDSDQDDFVRNRVTVLAEARVAFPVWRPASFAIADTTA